MFLQSLHQRRGRDLASRRYQLKGIEQTLEVAIHGGMIARGDAIGWRCPGHQLGHAAPIATRPPPAKGRLSSQAKQGRSQQLSRQGHCFHPGGVNDRKVASAQLPQPCQDVDRSPISPSFFPRKGCAQGHRHSLVRPARFLRQTKCQHAASHSPGCGNKTDRTCSVNQAPQFGPDLSVVAVVMQDDVGDLAHRLGRAAHDQHPDGKP
jgi:hypothetical protein